MLLVALKNLQAGLQKALQLRVTGRRNQLRLKRAVDSLVIGGLVGDISLVERRAMRGRTFGAIALVRSLRIEKYTTNNALRMTLNDDARSTDQ
jgi:hypothetical protein